MRIALGDLATGGKREEQKEEGSMGGKKAEKERCKFLPGEKGGGAPDQGGFSKTE